MENKELSVNSFLNNLKPLIAKAFEGQIFRVQGDIDKVVETAYNRIYINLVSKNDKYTNTMTVFIVKYNDKDYSAIKKGTKIEVTGTVAIGKNEIQLNVSEYRLLGISDTAQQYEKWHRRCEILSKRPKKRLPFICSNIAIISNDETHGYKDFDAHLEYGNVQLFSTKMQGTDIAENIAMNIEEINKQATFDCICIVRGGGDSINMHEFNSEILLEAIASSNIPVLTAIGHKDDSHLCDAVADQSYTTPTDIAKDLTSKMKSVLHRTQVINKNIYTRYEQIKFFNKKEDGLKLGEVVSVFAMVIIILILHYSA